jgi:hypothetical protein
MEYQANTSGFARGSVFGMEITWGSPWGHLASTHPAPLSIAQRIHCADDIPSASATWGHLFRRLPFPARLPFLLRQHLRPDEIEVTEGMIGRRSEPQPTEVILKRHLTSLLSGRIIGDGY